ncbi:MAG: NAD(P)-dependent oxidoreductase [Verrucomicrobiales bacterium]
MKRVGFIGLGDMGMAMALNLIKAGFELTGFDLRQERLDMLKEAGGKPASSPAEAAQGADAVFIMVMTGAQAEAVVCGEDGLLTTMARGSTILLTATIKPGEARTLIDPVAKAGVHLIDSPVSGGKGGADSGTLTLMASAPQEVFEANQDLMQAVGQKLFHVGEDVGMGQTVKASLQALIGSTFTAIFESLVLGSKAGVDGKVLYDVFTASGVGSPLLANCSKLIMDRAFKGTGSQIGTMYKDLGISMDMAKENGCSMFTAAAAHELFRAGISLFPEEDNWSIVKLLEQIADTEVKW